jgi:nuclear pore complex protein Nup214
VFLIYIQQWNMLLMASSNSMEVGVLGTTETGETPTWCQWVSVSMRNVVSTMSMTSHYT